MSRRRRARRLDEFLLLGESVCPRTIRAMVSQETAPMATKSRMKF